MEIDLEFCSGQEPGINPGVGINNDIGTVMNCGMPRNGMEFESKETAYSFYNEYARKIGFGITIKSSRRSKKSGKFIDIKIACSRFGSNRHSNTAISPKSCPKTDCKASMHIKKIPDGKWYICNFVQEHNHEIRPDDIYNNSVRGKKNRNDNALCRKKGLQLALDERDVQLLLDYFMYMQAEAPGFYYVLDFDKEACMRNVFWVDPKGRHDYVHFSDVVFFDTHYIKSKYGIPFVPIIGVNHHFQFVLLGCALIGDESQSTFVWLMRTWLRAVSGNSPKVVITDNDNSLIEAVSEVFPNAFHCFSPGHVLNEVGPTLSHKLSGLEVFVLELKECMFGSWSNEEFEHRWKNMVKEFDLADDKWMQSMYKDRRKWVPTYMRHVFLGGFCTVERSQSVASFFDKYLQKETKIEEFIDRYTLFLHERCEEEARADIETHHAPPISISRSPFEKQMSRLYTHATFKKFQNEVWGMAACRVRKEAEDEKTITFRVDDLERKQSFALSWDKGKCDMCCLCRLFEYNGFLCRHALSVLELLGISTIPSDYILKRWTRKAKIRDTTNPALINTNFRVQRLNYLCKVAMKLSEEGSSSGEAYQVAFNAIEEALKHCVGVNNSEKSVLETDRTAARGPYGKIKKVSKKQQVRSEDETLSFGIEESSQNVEQLNERSRSFHESYISQQDTQGMGNLNPNTLSSLHDCYYSDQPITQGVLGNLNAVSAHVSHHHTTEHNLQGMLQGQFSFGASSVEGCFQLTDRLHNETSVNRTSKHLHD
ncbi:hypothetical protein ABFS82_10G088300 [Erythranthe guttata]|uniref:protein FAR1-RELATED SEQUENCE 2 n=1 Tax=Erythranthe guttata TaxID=4155 RepID=UPI00064DAADC|nr:PREDICTED: protein FAR1-RELATED SEQUENCE 2 [Erythranthe guttata]|eukprot:XP_012848946.1 PREDICTED: protein FAR1-RELATED SEQUENCE 2 [Erythranthe guttata]